MLVSELQRYEELTQNAACSKASDQDGQGIEN